MTEGRLVVKRPVVLEVPLDLDSFYLIYFLQFLLPFSRKRLLLRWIVDIVKRILCHACYYNNNSDATFRLLMSGDINPNPGLAPLTAGKINCLVMNARSLKSYHNKTTQKSGNPCVTSIASRTCCAPKTLTLHASMRHG